jgi:hypothetical protein
MGQIIDDIDIKTRPLTVLTGHLVSYNYDENSDPIVREMIFKYNQKKYTLTISNIKVEQIEPQSENDKYLTDIPKVK